jgi:hypothetical protein
VKTGKIFFKPCFFSLRQNRPDAFKKKMAGMIHEWALPYLHIEALGMYQQIKQAGTHSLNNDSKEFRGWANNLVWTPVRMQIDKKTYNYF